MSDIRPTAGFNISFSDEADFLVSFESGMAPVPQEVYAGPYTVTPSQTTQTLPTAGKLMVEAVVVNPIPQNYGLITYNGFEIMVS